MLSVVIAIHLMLVIALIGVVLLQKSEGGGLVSSTSGFLSGRGTANVLSRTTALLAAGFFLTSLALSWIASYEHRPVSVISTSGGAAVPAPPTPGGSQPAAPLSTGGGLLNQMEKGFPSLPAGSNPNFTPEPPSGPQVPQSK
ncbi:MAG: preprotein translocase subunit SecG [Xanthobacteraceae bacterium]